MLSITTTQRLLQRLPRRQLPSRSTLLHGRQQQHQQQLPSISLLHTGLHTPSNGNHDKDKQVKHLPSQFITAQSPNIWNATIKMARNTPPPLIAINGRQVMWFSTSTKEEGDGPAAAAASTDATTESSSKKKKTYKQRAAQYGNQAKDGAKGFGGIMKMYGPVAIGTYLSIYAVFLGGLYAGVESTLLDPVTLLGYMTGNHDEARSSAVVVGEMMEHYTITQPFAEMVQEKPKLANFSIAWIACKFTEPLRLAATAAITPRVARHLGVGPNIVEVEIDNTDGEDAATASSSGEKKA